MSNSESYSSPKHSPPRPHPPNALSNISPTEGAMLSDVLPPSCAVLGFSRGASLTPTPRLQTAPRWLCRRGHVTPTKNGRQRGQKKAALYDRMESYKKHFGKMIDLELKAEQKQILQRNADWTRKRLESSGLAIFEVIFEDRQDQFGRKIVAGRLALPPKLARETLLACAFKKADLVKVSRAGLNFEATVVQKNQCEILISLPGSDTPSGRGWRLDQGASTISHDRCLESINRVTTQGPSSLSDVERAIVESFQIADVQRLYKSCKQSQTAVKAMRASPGFLNLHWQQIALSKQSRLPPRWEKKVDRLLDESVLSKSQKNAIHVALSRTVSLIQGPPGTGKTTTAGFLIACVVSLGIGPVMGVAHSNVGTDNLLKECVNHKLRVVRIGNPLCVRQDLQQYTVDAILEKDKKILALRRKMTGNLSTKRRKELSRMLFDVLQEKTAQIVLKADVVVSTCVGSAMDHGNLEFPFVLVDEASQSPEPCVGIPLQYKCKQFCLVGDHHQLPPTIVSRQAVKKGYDVSLFCRLAEHLKPSILSTQYRMHPDLAEVPSALFYGGAVWSGKSTRALSRLRSRTPWASTAVEFINVEGCELRGGSETTYSNPDEAREVINVLNRLRKSNIDPNSIGVIAPYWGQLRHLIDKTGGDDFLARVDMSTCDGFQGREKNVIILTTVRSNTHGQVGFVSDWRRMNVSLTRSRGLLLVIGNKSTLCRGSKDWRAWFKLQEGAAQKS